jgi:hypothetical protein
VRTVVETALALAGQPPLRDAKLAGVWPDPSGARTTSPVFTMPALRGAWSSALDGLAHPHTGALRPITFDHDVVAGRDDVVLVHLEHPLVRMSQRLLRAEVWSPAGKQGLHRVCARTATGLPADAFVVLAHARLVVIGGAHQALHEELIVAGGLLRGGRFERGNVTEVQQWFEHATDEPPAPSTHARLRSAWPTVAQALQTALDARKRDRTKTLESRMAARADEDVKNLTDVLDQLARTIRGELDDAGKQRQLTFDWTADEREQWDRNHDELQRRLAAIPAEIEAETQRLREAYSDPRPLLFPVSVTWLIPGG